jgi:DNA ligase (NAD+)
MDKDVIVRAEGFITNANFDKIQKLTNNKYKNSRNAASGISRRFDGDSCEYIQVLAYDINANVKTEVEKLEILKKLGFKVVPAIYCDTLEKVIEVYQGYKDTLRDKVTYPIDGLVLKLDSIDLQEKMGVTNNRPDGQIALKFSSDQAITKLNTIVDQVGRTGKLTPVGMLKPVELMGSTITKATLHNYAYIEENFISPDAEVVIEKKGDIIPQIVDVITPGKGYKRPDKCPSCGGSLIWDKVNLWCYNEGCREREVNRILYWIQVLDMKGFSSSFVEKLWDTGKIKRISDLYTLNPDSLTSIAGLGAKTIKSFFETLQAKKEMYLEQFIVALGITGVSKGTAGDLVSNFGTWDKILKVQKSDIVKIPGYADISSETICEGIQEVSEMAAELLKVIKIKEKKKGTLTGMSFCVTGSLEGMSRKEFEDLVVNEGGSFKSTISVGLGYLVTNTPDSGSGKNSKVRIINEKLDKEGAPGKKTKIITEKEFIVLAKIEPKQEPTKSDKDTPEVDLDFEPLFK